MIFGYWLWQLFSGIQWDWWGFKGIQVIISRYFWSIFGIADLPETWGFDSATLGEAIRCRGFTAFHVSNVCDPHVPTDLGCCQTISINQSINLSIYVEVHTRENPNAFLRHSYSDVPSSPVDFHRQLHLNRAWVSAGCFSAFKPLLNNVKHLQVGSRLFVKKIIFITCLRHQVRQCCLP